MPTLTAPVKWAQRKESLFVTIDLPDVEPETAKIDLTDKKLVFSGRSEGNDYTLELVFLHEIDSKSEDTKFRIKARDISFYLVKKEEERWARLLEDKTLQRTNVKCDFNKWVDSDEEDESNNFNVDGMGGMPGMGGGMGGMGGMDMSKMMQQMNAMQGGAGPAPAFDEGDGDDDDNGDEEEYYDSDDDYDENDEEAYLDEHAEREDLPEEAEGAEVKQDKDTKEASAPAAATKET